MLAVPVPNCLYSTKDIFIKINNKLIKIESHQLIKILNMKYVCLESTDCLMKYFIKQPPKIAS